jgi:hypothetical protein
MMTRIVVLAVLLVGGLSLTEAVTRAQRPPALAAVQKVKDSRPGEASMGRRANTSLRTGTGAMVRTLRG